MLDILRNLRYTLIVPSKQRQQEPDPQQKNSAGGSPMVIFFRQSDYTIGASFCQPLLGTGCRLGAELTLFLLFPL